MPAYQSEQDLSPTILTHWPIGEQLLSDRGVLLAYRAPRYLQLNSYIAQFGAPMASVSRAGLYQFYDPITPSLRIIVHCEAVHVCKSCAKPIHECSEPF